jgi:hypothetical protein
MWGPAFLSKEAHDTEHCARCKGRELYPLPHEADAAMVLSGILYLRAPSASARSPDSRFEPPCGFSWLGIIGAAVPRRRIC